jgi:uncharacterized protein (DUF433 family)
MKAMVKNPDILVGNPVLRGTRVPIQTPFDYLEGGETLQDFLEGFPTVSRESTLTALQEGKHLLLARPNAFLIDECIDERFRNSFPAHDCQTARFAGLAGVENGELLAAAG